MLEVKGLRVAVGGKNILNGVDLNIKNQKMHVLFGPNGSGKSVFASTLMGLPNYKVKSGFIKFYGENITNLPIYERVKRGIVLAFQIPPPVHGLKLGELIKISSKKIVGEEADPIKLIEKMKLKEEFANREVNVGFSGGEKKRAELAQVLALNPKLMILDEPDSGVDIESLKIVGDVIKEATSNGCSALIISHQRHVLRHVDPDLGHVMYKGRIIYSGDPHEILEEIEDKGYLGAIENLKEA